MNPETTDATAPVGPDQILANSHLAAAAPAMLEALHAVWQLANRLDIGTHEKTQFRDLVAAAIAEATLSPPDLEGREP
jgi:hypothetical protein